MKYFIVSQKKEKQIETKTKAEETVVEVETKKEVPAKGKSETKTKANTTKKETVKKEVNKAKTSAKKEQLKKVTNKKEKTATEKKVRKTSSTKIYHISLRKNDGKWQVKYGGGKKAIKLFDTQAEAIKFAEERAENQEGHISIHKKDGKIRKQDYSKKLEDKENK